MGALSTTCDRSRKCKLWVCLSFSTPRTACKSLVAWDRRQAVTGRWLSRWPAPRRPWASMACSSKRTPIRMRRPATAPTWFLSTNLARCWPGYSRSGRPWRTSVIEFRTAACLGRHSTVALMLAWMACGGCTHGKPAIGTTATKATQSQQATEVFKYAIELLNNMDESDASSAGRDEESPNPAAHRDPGNLL